MKGKTHLESRPQHDRVPKRLFKAVCFARALIKNGNRPERAIYISSRYYGFSTTEVAKVLGQHAARVRNNGRDFDEVNQ